MGSSAQVGVKIRNIWNHHVVLVLHQIFRQNRNFTEHIHKRSKKIDCNSLPETNISPENRPLESRRSLLETTICSGKQLLWGSVKHQQKKKQPNIQELSFFSFFVWSLGKESNQPTTQPPKKKVTFSPPSRKKLTAMCVMHLKHPLMVGRWNIMLPSHKGTNKTLSLFSKENWRIKKQKITQLKPKSHLPKPLFFWGSEVSLAVSFREETPFFNPRKPSRSWFPKVQRLNQEIQIHRS